MGVLYCFDGGAARRVSTSQFFPRAPRFAWWLWRQESTPGTTIPPAAQATLFLKVDSHILDLVGFCHSFSQCEQVFVDGQERELEPTETEVNIQNKNWNLVHQTPSAKRSGTMFDQYVDVCE